jgi:adenine-specific DNA-methyltransferase
MATRAVPRKLFGAFYTPPAVARCLVRWAVRERKEIVLDPSLGEGVFIGMSVERLDKLGGRGRQQVYGVEIDQKALENVRAKIDSRNLIHEDFFGVASSRLPKFNAVVGNPPFIRYQHFKGGARESALHCARRLGVELSELTSSWAPFLVHATEFVALGGRLAMVLPSELLHAAYARPIVNFVLSRFASVQLATFRDRLFPDLSQDTLLLFADKHGTQCDELRVRNFERIDELEESLEHGLSFGNPVSLDDIASTNGRLRNHLLDKDVAELYRFLLADSRSARLGELAQVGIGYVTGNNDYFHLDAKGSRDLQIPDRYLARTLANHGVLKGLQLTDEDWESASKSSERVYLLDLPRTQLSRLPKPVRRYVAKGRRLGVHKAYKCLVRKPWFSVPHSEPATAFLSYMSGTAPRLCWNSAQVLASNSMHEVRFGPMVAVEPWRLAFTFWSSLTQLSCEIEGHPMGGGMLKLEPSEAESVLVPRPEYVAVSWDQFQDLDQLMRTKSTASAIDLADDVVLRQTLGLNWQQIQVIRDGLDLMRSSRRKHVGKD